MGIIYVLLPISLSLAAIALVAYFWNVRNRQFRDLKGDSVRMLFDEEHSRFYEPLRNDPRKR